MVDLHASVLWSSRHTLLYAVTPSWVTGTPAKTRVTLMLSATPVLFLQQQVKTSAVKMIYWPPIPPHSATKYTLNIQPPWHTWTKEQYPSVRMDIFISVYHDAEPGSVNHTWMVTVADTCRCAWNLDPSSNSLVYMCNLRNVQTRKPITVSLSLSHTRHPPFPVARAHTHLRRHTWEGWRRAVCSAFRSIVINCSVNRGGSTSPALRLLQSCRARLCSALHNGMP